MPNFLDEVASRWSTRSSGSLLLYWVVRLAVRHGVLDAEESRGQS